MPERIQIWYVHSAIKMQLWILEEQWYLKIEIENNRGIIELKLLYEMRTSRKSILHEKGKNQEQNPKIT